MSDWQQQTGFGSAQAEHDNADGAEREEPRAFDYDLQEFIHTKAGDDALTEFFDLLTAFERRVLEEAEGRVLEGGWHCSPEECHVTQHVNFPALQAAINGKYADR